MLVAQHAAPLAATSRAALTAAPPADLTLRLALGLVFFSLPLAQTFVARGISVADCALTLGGAMVAARWHADRWSASPPAWFWPASLLVLWSVVGGIALSRGGTLPFSGVELARSLAKLLFYVVGGLLVGVAAARVGARRWARLLLAALTAHALLGLYVWAAMQLPWHLPYRFLFAGSQGGEGTAYAFTGEELFVRLRGMAAEPSYCGFFLVMGIATVLLAASSKRPGWCEGLVAAAIVLTLSLSAFALSAVAVPLVLLRRRRHAVVMLLVMAATLALGLLAPPLRRGFRAGLIDRAVGIATGTGRRVEVVRLHGSYSAALLMARRSPIFGAGLGNFDVALEAVLPQIDPELGMPQGSQGWSMPAYVLGTLGWPGLALLALLVAAACYRDWVSGILVAAAAVADGTLLGAPFWVFLALLTSTDRHGEARAAPGATGPPAGEPG